MSSIALSATKNKVLNDPRTDLVKVTLNTAAMKCLHIRDEYI